MPTKKKKNNLARFKKKYPEKFASEETAFRHIHWGDRILIGSGCGEPQHLLKALIKYVKSDPKALLDAEVFQIWAMEDAPYADETLQENLRHNSFFIGKNVRDAVNRGLADYTPVSFSDIPDMLRRGLIPLDVAIIQVTPPDKKGRMSLGVSVDIVKAAVERSNLVIAQVNRQMPWTHGDGIINLSDVDYLIPFDEPLLEYTSQVNKETAKKIRGYLSRLVHDGETIQAGYGGLINAALAGLAGKKNLGIHTEMLSDGLVSLIKKGAVDNHKTINSRKTIASFCIGSKETYKYIDNNAAVEFRTIDYTDNPLVIAKHDNMTAINSALAIDLTGQASEESVGRQFYGGIGGQANFMRGAALSKNGKSILVLESTADNGKTSRITPYLPEGAGVTLNRGDVHYVVTEYGIAYLHGKNIRERAMELIGIAHPKFRGLLIEEARELNLIYGDQTYIAGNKGACPEGIETYRTTWNGLRIKIRPVRISDEHLLKQFFYSLTDETVYRRFASARKDMPHNRLQGFTVIDYDKQMILLALLEGEEKEELIGIGQYNINEDTHMGDVAFVVRDDHQHQGVGSELLKFLTYVGKRKGLMGFTAEVLSDNGPMKTLFKETGFKEKKRPYDDMYEYTLLFRRRQ